MLPITNFKTSLLNSCRNCLSPKFLAFQVRDLDRIFYKKILVNKLYNDQNFSLSLDPYKSGNSFNHQDGHDYRHDCDTIRRFVPESESGSCHLRRGLADK